VVRHCSALGGFGAGLPSDQGADCWRDVNCAGRHGMLPRHWPACAMRLAAGGERCECEGMRAKARDGRRRMGYGGRGCGAGGQREVYHHLSRAAPRELKARAAAPGSAGV
jgi:hypothetical protein